MLLEKKMVKSLLINKKAQVWSLDLLVALIIFVIGLVVIYFYALNYQSTTYKFEGLSYDADLISNLLLGENEDGIVTDGKVNQSKLDEFDSLSDFEKKSVLGVSNNFYFTMPQLEVGGGVRDSVGIVNVTSVNHLVKVTRITIYKEKPTKLEVVVWQ
jgi:hypothetical protein